MASGQTALRKRPFPEESDAPDAAADMQQLATNLDQVANVNTGASLPTTGMVIGDEFCLSGTLQWYKFNGTSWLPMLVAGAWLSLTTASGVTAGSRAPEARLAGDIVQFRGTLNTNLVAAGGPLATVPSTAFRPPSNVWLPPVYLPQSSGGQSPAAIEIEATTGQLVTAGQISSESTAIVSLDGLWYPLT